MRTQVHDLWLKETGVSHSIEIQYPHSTKVFIMVAFNDLWELICCQQYYPLTISSICIPSKWFKCIGNKYSCFSHWLNQKDASTLCFRPELWERLRGGETVAYWIVLGLESVVFCLIAGLVTPLFFLLIEFGLRPLNSWRLTHRLEYSSLWGEVMCGRDSRFLHNLSTG